MHLKRIPLKKIIFLVLVILYWVEIAQAGEDDATLIENMCKNGGTVQLESRTYTIHRSFNIPSDITLIGQDNTVLIFADECGIAQNVPMVSGINQKNIVIQNIRFEGNQDHQKYALKISNPNHPEQSGKKAYGNQVNTFIYLINCENIKVTNCSFNDNLGDGLRLSGCKNIEFSYNTGEMGGHDTLFALRCEGVSVYNNNIHPLVNSAVRLLDCSHVRVYNNFITWEGPRDAGPAMQIQHDKGEMKDIEVCNNVVMSSCGPGLWLVGKTQGNDELWLHHNLFMNCGDNRITWVGGIVASGYDNAKIENNVFDSCYRGSIVFYAVSSGWATSANAALTANIFTSAKAGKLDGIGPYGVENTISDQNVSSSKNCYYSNTGGNTQGCEVSSSDIFIDPKQNKTPSGWRWTGTEWQCEQVKPSEMGEIGEFTPLTDEELQDAEESAQEFDSIFDVLSMSFTDSGITTQTAEDINYSVVETEHGKIKGGIKILGFKDVVVIDNVSYIQNNESVLVKYTAIKSPSFNLSGSPRITKTVSTKIENGIAYATLDVKMKYTKFSTNSVTGKMTKRTKTTKATFEDSCVAHNVFSPPGNIEGTIYTYPTFFQVCVPSSGLVKVKYEYDGNNSEQLFLTGMRNKTDSGVEYTEYAHINRWDGKLEHQGDWINVLGIFDPTKLNVTVYTPYENIQVTEFKIVNHNFPERAVARWFYPFIMTLLILFLYIMKLHKDFKKY